MWTGTESIPRVSSADLNSDVSNHGLWLVVGHGL
jgi:hypothetical protein